MNRALQPAPEYFTRPQVRRILGLSESRLSAWERQGLVTPITPFAAGPDAPTNQAKEQIVEGGPLRKGSGRSVRAAAPGGCYTFSDLVALRKLLALRKSGVPPSRLRLANQSLRRKLASVEQPWSQLQIQERGKHLVVQLPGARMEAVSGQFLLDYESGLPPHSADAAVSKVHTFQRGEKKPRTAAQLSSIAERFFLAGLRYEECGAPPEKAIRAYQRAIEINPQAVGAYINLGTVYYNLGQMEAAESCYAAALSIDPDYGLVHFNMGNVADEHNDLPLARLHYETAIRLDPSYPDPHYNLALVYEKLRLHGQARRQWLSYLKQIGRASCRERV